ncbi:MAG: hypothetical protein AAGJ55_03150 [Cyanobacteria bacterium J06555_12]
MALTARMVLVALALASSLLSIGLFMAGTGENNIPLVRKIWLLYLISGFAIGCCLPRRWYVAVLVAWLPLMLLPEYLWGLAAGGGNRQNAANEMAAIMFATSPLIALLGGWLGANILGKHLVATNG